MSAEWRDIIGALAAMMLTGVVMKWLDDWLDAETDFVRGARTFAARHGKAALPYSLLAMAVSVLVNRDVTVSLLFGSIGLGMISVPFKGKYAQLYFVFQALLAALCSVWISGPWMTLWAFTMVAFAHWVDDIVDMAQDRLTRQFNVALHLGIMPALFASLAALLLAVVANALYTVLGLFAVSAINLIAEWSTQVLWKTTDDEEEHQRMLQ